MGLRDDDLKELEIILLENPRKGAVIEGLAGARKLRIKLEGRGKSGGGIYLDIIQKERIYLLFAYPKNVQEDLSSEQKKVLRKLVDVIVEE